MPASPPSPPPKGSKVKIVRKVLADGTVREYHYDRVTKARLPGPGAVARKKKILPPAKGIEGVIEGYLRSQEFSALARRTQDNHERELKWLARLGDIDPKDIRRPALLELRDIIAKKRGPGAANIFISVMSSFFTWAMAREKVELNPAAGIARLEGGELPPWTEDEAQRVMRPGVLPESVRRAAVLAYYTGQRRGDLVAMTWAAYDGQRIRLTQRKTGVSLVLPVEPGLKQELDAWRAENKAADQPGIHILTSSRGPWTPNALSHAFLRELGRLKGFRPGLNIHGFRKLRATLLAQAGCSAHQIMAITGHTTLGMVQHYTKAADQERLALSAVELVETKGRKV